MTAKIIGEHNERQYEKENIHRVSHKQPSGDAGTKRNKTSENTQRSSAAHSRVGTHSHISMAPQSNVQSKSNYQIWLLELNL